MSGLAVLRKSEPAAFPPHSADVVRSPPARARKAKPVMDAPASLPKPWWETAAGRLEREQAAPEKLKRLLVDLDAPPIDEPARRRLQRLSIGTAGARHAANPHDLESEGNESASVETVVSAVSAVKNQRFESAARAPHETPSALLHFYKPPTLREKLETRAEAPLRFTKGQKALPKSGLFSTVGFAKSRECSAT
jgi:hypothetical protein